MVAISVVMPVYDAEAYVDAALRSIRDQTCEDFEFLIYDDGSTDRSAEIVEAHAQRDSRIHFARKDHRGLTPWLCEGVAEAQGEFVARMDADDVARPERLARQLAYMRANPECVAVGGEVLLIDPDGWPLRIQGVALGHEAIETALLRGRGEAIVHPVALFRHAALKTVGSYRTECEPAEDLDLYLRLANHGRGTIQSDLPVTKSLRDGTYTYTRLRPIGPWTTEMAQLATLVAAARDGDLDERSSDTG